MVHPDMQEQARGLHGRARGSEERNGKGMWNIKGGSRGR